MENQFKFIIPNDKHEGKYIGFNFENDNSSFVFPCQYFNGEQIDEKIKEQVYQRESKKIITLLKRVNQEYLLNGRNEELFQFHSMIWLINDYINHGYYVETETISSTKSNGKINWKKTIKQNSILFNNQNIIYKDFVRNKISTNDSKMITQIYKACLKYSVQRLGFIFSIKQTENSIFDIESKDKDFIIYYLNNELNNTFRDYKKTLLSHLLSIVNNQNSKNKNMGFSIYDSEFEYVFEFLVNKVFGTEDVKLFYNTYSYYLPDKVPTSKLRPDTIMKDEKNKTYYIVDAKYYNYGYSYYHKDLPASSSISKQVGYNHFIKDKLKDNEEDFDVKSIFVLPYASTVKGEYIKYIGYAQSDENKNENKNENDKVAVCLVDLRELINTYFNDSKNLNSNTLIQSLPI